MLAPSVSKSAVMIANPLHVIAEAKALAERQLLAESAALLGRLPNDPQCAFHRAFLLLVLKRFAEAETALRTVLAVQPGNAEALVGLATALTEQSRPAEALHALGRVVGGGARIRYLRGVALDEAGRTDEAATELNAARAEIIAPLERRGMVPWEVYVQLSRRCNLRCTMCGHEVWQSNAGVMEWPVFDRVLAECKANNVTTLHVLSGQGEPLLNPHAFEMLERAVAQGLKVGIVTNGTPLTPQRIERLAGLGLAYVQFSFGGWDKDSYESVYVGADFDKTLGKLVALNKALPPGHPTTFAVKAVTAGDWTVTQERTKAFLAAQGIDRVWTVVANNFGGTVQTGSFHAQHGIWSMRAIDHHRRMPCRVLLKSVGVFCDGSVTACGCYDSNAVLKLGNIMEQSLAEIRNGERFQTLLAGFRTGDLTGIPMCEGCDDPFG